MNRFVLLGIGLMFAACNPSDDDQGLSGCDFSTLSDAVQFVNAPSDLLTLTDISFENQCLHITFTASGCDGSTWDVKLIDAEMILESAPPRRRVRVSLKNDELCEALITKQYSFDIENLQVSGASSVVLEFENSGETFLYQYE